MIKTSEEQSLQTGAESGCSQSPRLMEIQTRTKGQTGSRRGKRGNIEGEGHY